jgi:hypothetical protein
MRRLPYYKLDEAGDPVSCQDMLEWTTWFATSAAARVVAKTELPSGTAVSTEFLGIDQGFGDGDPVLWATMTFGGEYDLACDRYRSKKEALAGHEMWVLVAKGEITPIDARHLKAGLVARGRR